MRGRADAKGFEAVIAADAVILVDDEVAFGDFGGFGDELVGTFPAPRGAADTLAEQILLRDEAELGGDEAAFEPEGDDGGGVERHIQHGFPLAGVVGFDPVFAQQVQQALAGAARPGGDYVRRFCEAQLRD